MLTLTTIGVLCLSMPAMIVGVLVIHDSCEFSAELAIGVTIILCSIAAAALSIISLAVG